MKQAFFATAMRKKIYTSLTALQRDLDAWLWYYNAARPHSGKYCYGKTPLQTFMATKGLAVAKPNELMFHKEVAASWQLTAQKIE